MSAPRAKNEREASTLQRYLVAAAWVYFTLFALWAFSVFLTGDRYPIVAVLNILAPYLFFPSVAVLPLAIYIRRRELWIGLAFAVGGFVLLWGALFIPKRHTAVRDNRMLTVMNYNAYARNLSSETPLIVAGDANATDLSDAYAFLSDDLVDSWREAGAGFGHTYPSSSSPGIPALNLRFPNWLVRIDYIFHSEHWEAIDARVAPSSGGSDHRAVIAELVLRQPGEGTELVEEDEVDAP